MYFVQSNNFRKQKMQLQVGRTKKQKKKEFTLIIGVMRANDESRLLI